MRGRTGVDARVSRDHDGAKVVGIERQRLIGFRGDVGWVLYNRRISIFQIYELLQRFFNQMLSFSRRGRTRVDARVGGDHDDVVVGGGRSQLADNEGALQLDRGVVGVLFKKRRGRDRMSARRRPPENR